MRFSSARSTALAWTLAIVSLAGLAAIAVRVPISEGDDAFYASVVRSAGAPPFDYLRFYGPVFFRAAAASFAMFGFSIGAFRAVSVIGALLIAASVLMLTRALGGDREHQAWACALLVLSPEVGWAATAGRMDSLAVGLALLGLACLARAVVRRPRAPAVAIGAGILLAGAALTSPRTYPFMLGLIVASAVSLPLADPDARRPAIRQLTIAFVTAFVLFGGWVTIGAGGPVSWLRVMWAIATQQRDDVLLLGGRRILSFAWSRVATPAAGIAGGLAFASQSTAGRRGSHALAARLALVTAWTAFVVSAAIFNMTLFFGAYFVVPLFAVVLALPAEEQLRRRSVIAAAIALVAFFGAVRVTKQLRAAVTWSARDPARLDAFVAAHVPPGSLVVGPHYLYFFPVERNGSHFRSANRISWADWTQWIPDSERTPMPPTASHPVDRLMLWPTDADSVYGPMPPGCAAGPAIAIYTPPPDDLPRLHRLVEGDDLRGYPEAALYRLTSGCVMNP